MVQTTSSAASSEDSKLSALFASATIAPDTLGSEGGTGAPPPPVVDATESLDGESPVSSFVKKLDAVAAYGGDHYRLRKRRIFWWKMPVRKTTPV